MFVFVAELRQEAAQIASRLVGLAVKSIVTELLVVAVVVVGLGPRPAVTRTATTHR